MLPKDFPPVSTVQRWFYAWRNSGLWLNIDHMPVMRALGRIGREASPTAGVIDSQSVKATESGGVRGYSRWPWLRHVFADSAYAGDKLRDALKGQGDWTFEIVKRSDTAQGFEVLPRRWVVERTFAWPNRKLPRSAR